MKKHILYLSPLKQPLGWLIVLIVVRIFFNTMLPLMDKTEARYSEIARLMQETGDWVVPQIDYGTVFWAKPPLSTWLSAASVGVFGINEFAVRLPYLLVCVLIAVFIGRYRSREGMSPYLPGLLLFSLPEFFLHAGVVSTDTLLLFCVTGVMLSFWEGIQENASHYWRLALFAFMGLGLLAKGPIVGILTVPPILLWCALSDFQWKDLLRFPLVLGPIITLGIAVPWYVLAERQSPGFIDYFIVGEHFRRYLDAGWQGDKYGFPKQQPLGIAWAFLVGAVLFWVPTFVRLLRSEWNKIRRHPWAFYLVLWLLWTPLFFTSSKSLIHPYVLPSTVPFALLIMHYWESLWAKKTSLVIAVIFPLLLVGVYASGIVDPLLRNSTDKYLIEKATREITLYAYPKKKYSSQWYSRGKVKELDDASLLHAIQNEPPFYVLMGVGDWEQLPLPLKQQLKPVEENNKRGIYVLSP